MVKEFCGRVAHAWTKPTANAGDMLAINGPAIAPIEEVGLMHMIVAMAQVDLRCAVSRAGHIKKHSIRTITQIAEELGWWYCRDLANTLVVRSKRYKPRHLRT